MNEHCLARVLAPPVVLATFKSVPADFRVRETLGFPLSGQGEHAYLYIRKIGANTAWVAEQLAKTLGLRRHDVSYAGRKDRHAETEQWFSCWLPGREDPDWSALDIEGASVLLSTRHDKKLRRGMHEANHFEIRLRDLRAPEGVSAREEIEARLLQIGRHGVPNYFGEQRFGHDGANIKMADDLLTGKLRSGRKKDIYLSAARSYLFNIALSKRVSSATWLDESYGWLPGIARDGEYTGNADDEALAWQDGFRRLDVRPMRREWALVPGDLSAVFEKDDMILSFTLPVGSYATSVLREMVAYE